MGSLAQISSGAIRCSFHTRFRRAQKVPVQILRLGFGRFWCRAKVKVRSVPGGCGRVPVQSLGEVLDGSGAEVTGADT